VTAANLPALVVSPEHQAVGLAVRFAQAAKTDNTTTARLRDLLGQTRTPKHGVRPVRTRAWIPWCADQGIDPLGEVRPAHLLAWIADLRADGDAESSRNRRLSTVSAWYKYLVREGTVPANPVERIESGEKPNPAKKIYSTSPIAAPSQQQMLDLQLAADAEGVYASAVVALMSHTGARVSELAGADVESLGEERGHPVVTILGKGGKRRVLPLPPPAWRRVSAMLTAQTPAADRLPALTAGAKQARPLLVNPRTGERATRQSITRLLRRIACRARLGKAWTPHGLRGAYATTLLDNGVPIYDVQRAMGHVSTETTARYDHSHLDLDRHPNYRIAALLTPKTHQEERETPE